MFILRTAPSVNGELLGEPEASPPQAFRQIRGTLKLAAKVSAWIAQRYASVITLPLASRPSAVSTARATATTATVTANTAG